MKRIFIICGLLFSIGLSNNSIAQNFEKLSISLPEISGSAQWGDYNSDGKLDIILQGRSNNVTITRTVLLKNTGNGSFSEENIPFAYECNAYNAAKFADMDNDGLIDIVSNGSSWIGNGVLQVYFNNGNGSFQQVSVNAGRTYGVTEIRDFNNDGLLDIYTNGARTANQQSGGAEIIANLGNRNFSILPLAQIPLAIYADAKCIDINHDGLVDILQGTQTGLYTFINKGNFVFFEENITGPLYSSANGDPILIEDFNNDGMPDIISYESGESVIFFKQTDGSYIRRRLFLSEIPNTTSQCMVSGDLNNDGSLDLVVPLNDKIYMFSNDGTGSFPQYEIIENSYSMQGQWEKYAISLGDMDNDGDLDIVATSDFYNTGTGQHEYQVAIYKNNTSAVNNAPNWNSTLGVNVINDNVSFNWKPANDDHTSKKCFKYILFIGKWDDVNNKVSQIISPSNTASLFNGIPISPGLIAYPEMAIIDTFAIRQLDIGKYIAAVVQIDQSYKVGSYGAEFFEVTNFSCPAPVPVVENASVCGSGKATLAASGGTSYTWYNGGGILIASGPTFTTPFLLTTTTYYVANNDGTCESRRKAVIVTVNPIPTVSIATIPDFINVNSAPVNLSGLPSGGTFSGDGVSGNIFTPGIAGLGKKLISYTYTGQTSCSNSANKNVIVYDTLGTFYSDTIYTHISVTDTLIIDFMLTGVNPPDNLVILKVYPNPAKEYITINTGNYFQMSGYSIRIINSLGTSVFETTITQPLYHINLSTWSGKGVYILQVYDSNKTIRANKKIILQ